MKNVLNEDLNKMENKSPEWVEDAVNDAWLRIDELATKKQISYAEAGKKYSFSPSSVYSSLKNAKSGEKPRDTSVRIFEALAEELGTSLNELVHGLENHDDDDKINKDLINKLFDLANGDYFALFLSAMPYLDVNSMNAVREDIIARFK